MNESDIAWFTGLFEGDGSISASERQVKLVIALYDEDVIEQAYSVWKPLGIGTKSGWQPTAANRKYVHCFRTGDRKQVETICRAMWPWLGQRRKQQIVDAFEKLAMSGYLLDNPFAM